MNGHFWDLSLANIVTWTLIVGGYVASQYIQTKLNAQRMNGFAKWVEKHEDESHDRDVLLQAVGKTMERLSVLSEVAERRLQNIEDRQVYVRSNAPDPYYGPERRRK